MHAKNALSINVVGHEDVYLYDLFEDVIDFRGRTPKKLGMDWGGGDIISLSANNVKKGYIDFDAECNLGSDALYHRWMGDVPLEKGDILFTMEAPLGNVAILPDDKKYILSQRVMALKTNERVINDFLFQVMLSDKFQSNLVLLSTGSTAKGINQKNLKRIKLRLPPLEEQRKIAACLSTWDKAIDAYDRLIALKEQQKIGIFQSLFSEIENSMSFSSVLDVFIGGTPSRSNHMYWDKKRETNNRWISIANMKSPLISDSTEYISDLGVENSNVKLLKSGTVIFSFKLSLGKKAILGKHCYTNEAIAGLVIHDENQLDRDYLYHALSVVDIDKEIDQAVKGKTLNKAKLNRLKLPWCSFYTQKKIACILNCAENEIRKLSDKRDLLKRQKQGLMQQLLA
jgi:type I restriction enzyme S subunit